MARGLRKSPGFTIAVVLTLALGIGGNTAIFSVVDQLLLRPLPYPRRRRLVTVYESFVRRSAGGINAPRRPQLRLTSQLAGLAARQPHAADACRMADGRVHADRLGDPTRLHAQLVSSEFFPLLGVRATPRPDHLADDDRPNAPRVAVLSHQLWQGRFGGDPSILGRIDPVERQAG